MLHISLPPQTTSAKRGPSPRVVPLLSTLPAGAHLYRGEELQVTVPNIPFVCPVSVCLFPRVDVKMCTEYAGNIPWHKSSKTWQVLLRAYKLPLSCPAHLPLLTACHCLAKVSSTPTWLFFLSKLSNWWKYTWSHYLWQDNRGLLLKKSTGNIGVKVVSIITSPSTPVFDVMLMILFHKTDPKPYFQIILMMSKLLGVWVQHLFIALVTCCN